MPCENFSDLAISNALVRPGALLTQGDDFVKRRVGSKNVKYKHEVLEPILKETYGTFIFQEQLMQAVVALAGFSWSDADSLRKIIGKKRDVLEFKKYRDQFVENNLMEEEDAQRMWDDFEGSSLYMFNKSHAVAYSMLSYQSMWLKILYPVEFCWALLYNESNRERVTAYLLEAKRLGITIEPPDVNLSEEFFSVDGSSIRFGLSNVDGIGVGAIDEILTKRPFSSVEEMTGRCEKRKLRSNILENLDKIGALNSLGHVSEFDHIKYYMPLLGFPIAEAVDDSGNFTPAAEIEDDNIAMHFVKAVVRSVKRTPSYVRIEFEDPTGSFTVFADLDNELKKRDYVHALVGDRTLHCYADATETVNEVTELMDMVESGLDHDHAWLYDNGLGTITDEKALVKVVNVRSFKTAKGKMMASLYVWDGNGFHKIVIFPYLYGRYGQRLSKIEGQWVAVKPTPISKDDEGYKVDGAEAIIDINDYCRRMKINVSN
jgi:DNA polymerase-3 subunit alpha